MMIPSAKAAAWRAAVVSRQRCLSTTPQLQRKPQKKKASDKKLPSLRLEFLRHAAKRISDVETALFQKSKENPASNSKPQWPSEPDSNDEDLGQPQHVATRGNALQSSIGERPVVITPIRDEMVRPPKTPAELKRRFKSVPRNVCQALARNFEIMGISPEQCEEEMEDFANSHLARIATKPGLAKDMIESFNSDLRKNPSSGLSYDFQSSLYRRSVATKDRAKVQNRLMDLKYPPEWFPATRSLKRTVHCHLGPTNSGKTYHALLALEKSKRGVYAGPLRLLAAEVYNRFTAKGRACALFTGEEIRVPEDTDHYLTSCTAEMIPLNTRFDVAVIDEIQLLAHDERGNAWTTALLGVQATEVHVCGEERTLPIIQSLCNQMGDECIVHEYKRLSPLKTCERHLHDLGKLEKGDAVIGFSRVRLHTLKKLIEVKTNRRCAIIYGSLPPEVRAQQAALFNDPANEYDFMVGSDAIGMGLNLEIQRIIFDECEKFNGRKKVSLEKPEIKQIAGRAGRFRTARHAISAVDAPGSQGSVQKIGYVTSRTMKDLGKIKAAFKAKIEPIVKAVIEPPTALVEHVASFFPRGTPLTYILTSIKRHYTTSKLYDVRVTRDMMEIAAQLEDIPLTIHDRLTFCRLPARLRLEGSAKVLRALATIVAENRSGHLLDITEIPLGILDINPDDVPDGDKTDYLERLEMLHIAINEYVWLSYRYAGVFRDQAMAFHVRSLVEERLIYVLEHLDYTIRRKHPWLSPKDEQEEKKVTEMTNWFLDFSQRLQPDSRPDKTDSGSAGMGEQSGASRVPQVDTCNSA